MFWRFVTAAVGSDHVVLRREPGQPRPTALQIASPLGRCVPGVDVVSIGPETSRAAREAGLTLVAEAAVHSNEGIAIAIAGLGRRA